MVCEGASLHHVLTPPPPHSTRIVGEPRGAPGLSSYAANELMNTTLNKGTLQLSLSTKPLLHLAIGRGCGSGCARAIGRALVACTNPHGRPLCRALHAKLNDGRSPVIRTHRPQLHWALSSEWYAQRAHTLVAPRGPHAPRVLERRCVGAAQRRRVRVRQNGRRRPCLRRR